MKRRDFIRLLGGAMVGLPRAARAQQGAMPLVGVLDPGVPEPGKLTAFLKGLGESGYVEGRNVAIEYRWAQGELDRLPDLTADLVGRRPAVIAATGTSAAALAAKAATTTIPIVFGIGVDPVQLGLVASLNRPGGNVTGIHFPVNEYEGKRLELLHQLVPSAARVAVLSIPNNPATDAIIAGLRPAAAAMGMELDLISAGSISEIDKAFAGLATRGAGALLVNPEPRLLFQSRRVQFALMAVRYRLPAMYSTRTFVEVGGLASYGPDTTDIQYRQVGVYVGRILKGEKPADLPVQRATKYEFVINRQAARAIDLDIPPMLLAIADEVIE
jgi:putative tryptophan/tyrosine transport system substrate-binding protein